MNSFFNSINNLTKLSNWLQVAVVIFGLLTASAIAFNIYVSNRISKLKDAGMQKISNRLEIAENKAKPRSFSKEQAETILAYLSNNVNGEVDLIYVSGDSETLLFALEIEKLLINAGWKIKQKVGSAFSKNPFHISLRVHSFNTAPQFTDILQKAFKLANIQLPIFEFNNYPTNSLTFIVGSKLQ